MKLPRYDKVLYQQNYQFHLLQSALDLMVAFEILFSGPVCIQREG